MNGKRCDMIDNPQQRRVMALNEHFKKPTSSLDSASTSIESGCFSMSSDLSSTDSSSMNDDSRKQRCESSDDVTGVIQKTKQLDIESDCDSGYQSFPGETKQDGPEKRPNDFSISGEKGAQYVQLFAQTGNMIYIMAAVLPFLLQRNIDGDTALHVAIINCHVDMIMAILGVLYGKYLDVYNNLIQTPLHLAVITRQHAVVEKLIDCGASLDLVDRNGQTCIHLACQRGDVKSLRAIFKSRPNYIHLREILYELLESRNFDGLTPLCVAVKENHIEIVKELIKLGANTNEMDSKSGNTALHLAVEANNLTMLSCLLFEGNADPNVVSYSGSTPLHIAAGLNLETIIATLIAVGASTTIENSEGDTPFELAECSNEENEAMEN